MPTPLITRISRTLSALAVTSAIAFAGAPAMAASWTVDPAKSTVGFSVAQGNETITGTFKDWTADIDFDPQNPEAATIKATIKTGSAGTGNGQFDAMLPSADWFNAEAMPDATFESSKVTALGGDTYRADGTLTIKGISQPATLDFKLEIDGTTAHATGTASVNRLAHEVGTVVGKSQIADTVAVTIDLTATE
ncbi:YceI family protein [Roseibium litorale]|uniref:YceI family protein n=1 Tax=Roseibium litorale TaxID=2803841 RepID=A0ABR9CPS9_9HYPH|nr:YceI family protein [Roseibium litorale]MBD8892847.1 YceI family protein [Roseibium litorale]